MEAANQCVIYTHTIYTYSVGLATLIKCYRHITSRFTFRTSNSDETRYEHWNWSRCVKVKLDHEHWNWSRCVKVKLDHEHRNWFKCVKGILNQSSKDVGLHNPRSKVDGNDSAKVDQPLCFIIPRTTGRPQKRVCCIMVQTSVPHN